MFSTLLGSEHYHLQLFFLALVGFSDYLTFVCMAFLGVKQEDESLLGLLAVCGFPSFGSHSSHGAPISTLGSL